MKELQELTPIQTLRRLTGIIDPRCAVDTLMYVNLIARYLDHDELLEDSFLLKQFEKIGIKLILEER